MSKGFFSLAKVQSKPVVHTVPRCGLCGLYKHCKSPKMKPTGQGRKGILVVAEAPGATEDEQGTQLVGDSGKYLRKVLRSYGASLDRDCWKTNAIICHKDGNVTPTKDELEYCRPNLLATIKRYHPKVIILLGGPAIQTFVATVWHDKFGTVDRWVGWQVPDQTYNAWVCPTWHPSYLIRGAGYMYEMRFEEHIMGALKHKRRPYQTVPNYKQQIQCLNNDVTAVVAIKDMLRKGDLHMVDLETNCLKPEYAGSRIFSCAISNSKRTIAFPYTNATAAALKRLLYAKDYYRGAANAMFEDRWLRYYLGRHVRWHWDTVIATHVVDNRKDICSTKFQAYVQLGQPDYDSHINPYLVPPSKTGLNTIADLDMGDLLLYNGMDSHVEYRLARKQQRQLERELGAV